METRKSILDGIRAYLARRGMSEHRFGMEAVGDHKLVARLRSGAGITLTNIEKVEAYMRDNPVPVPADNPPAGDEAVA